jgi:DNA-binding transcriptional MocR family regulator
VWSPLDLVGVEPADDLVGEGVGADGVGRAARRRQAARRPRLTVLDQLTFADFLSRGEFDRHLRRLRPVYRRRRDALLTALAEYLPRLEPVGIAAGLHLVPWLPDHLDETTVVAAAADQGIAVAPVSDFRLTPTRRAGLIFGYSSLDERAIADGIARLARHRHGWRRNARLTQVRFLPCRGSHHAGYWPGSAW